ncbi:MAG: sugar phosphate nucleotidyltransferase, partial [Nitrososphaerales archaeon]
MGLQAVILVGGLGTRLRDIVKDRPKPLALINGRPFLEYQIAFLKKYNIRDIVLCIGYQGEKIEEYFSDGIRHGVSIRYSREKELLGTGGAIKNARNLLEKRFFVLNGDTLFLIDLYKMLNFHLQNSADVTIALTKTPDQTRYGSVTIN